jgi:hypothetical protein
MSRPCTQTIKIKERISVQLTNNADGPTRQTNANERFVESLLAHAKVLIAKCKAIRTNTAPIIILYKDQRGNFKYLGGTIFRIKKDLVTW